MDKAEKSNLLTALAGKRVMIGGKYKYYGVEDSLKNLVAAQQGQLVQEPDDKTDFVVLVNLNEGKTLQKKVLTLNAKGAAIQVIEMDNFLKMHLPSQETIVALIKQGTSVSQLLVGATLQIGVSHNPAATQMQIVGESFDGIDLSGMVFSHFLFIDCSFKGAILNHTTFKEARNCDFSGSTGYSTVMQRVENCKFIGAKLARPAFAGIQGSDFSEGSFLHATFGQAHNSGRRGQLGVRFVKAKLQNSAFNRVFLQGPVFDDAEMEKATLNQSTFEDASFRGTNLTDAVLAENELQRSNFAGANLTGASFANAKLTDSKFEGANLKNCNLRGAALSGVNLGRAINYVPVQLGVIGPALKELDQLAQTARRIQMTFHVSSGKDDDGHSVGIDTSGLKYGWGVSLPTNSFMFHRPGRSLSFSDAMWELANYVGHLTVRFDSLDISSTKSPKGGKELRELILKGISEAFAQPMPADAELAAATKAWREKHADKSAATAKQTKEEREKAAAEAEKAKAAEQKKVEKAIEKTVGKVTDTATFLKALELRIELAKIKKATSMLKKDGFQLFNDIGEAHLYGVVKSQTDAELVYACSVDAEGKYSCCTQNLNVCGGLRGSICKHLLVLIIGLVQAGALDPNTIDTWVAKTGGTKPELDKEKMGEIFIRYKGAEAGEVDWRPTETVPEDYYTL